ncbi:MAG: EamA family transporter [Verrucomicrobia bacterium]|nr:EamA family transporter [Verrucomicrobiota bacterium]
MHVRAVLEGLFWTLTISAAQVLWKLAVDKTGGLFKPGVSLFNSTMSLLMSPYMIVGLILYAAATVFWMYLLAKYDLSFIYPMMSMVFIFTLLASRFVLGEPVGMQKWFGVSAIIVGIVLISKT